MGHFFSKSTPEHYKILPDVEVRLHKLDLETDIEEEEEKSSDVIAMAYLFSVI